MEEISHPLQEKKNELLEIGTNMLRIVTDFISNVQKLQSFGG